MCTIIMTVSTWSARVSGYESAVIRCQRGGAALPLFPFVEYWKATLSHFEMVGCGAPKGRMLRK